MAMNKLPISRRDQAANPLGETAPFTSATASTVTKNKKDRNKNRKLLGKGLCGEVRWAKPVKSPDEVYP